jgi:anti-sigma28 factor (negative regulator of flagellin synthesis)
MGIELSSGFADVPKIVMKQTPREMLSGEGLSEKLPEDLSARVSELTARALEALEIRWDRVAVLKKQIAAGEFQVSAEDLAGAILAEMRVQAP